MDAGRRIGGAGPAGDEAYTRLPSHLADRLRHHAGSALLTADGDGQIAVMLRERPFYLESGGQISDRGEIIGNGWRMEVVWLDR